MELSCCRGRLAYLDEMESEVAKWRRKGEERRGGSSGSEQVRLESLWPSLPCPCLAWPSFEDRTHPPTLGLPESSNFPHNVINLYSFIILRKEGS